MESCQVNTLTSLIKYEGRGYIVHSDGRVYSCTKKRYLSTNRISKNKYEYCCVGLGQKSFYVHRLVADCFIPNPDNLPEVNHIDEDKTNNHVSNLEWISRKGNMKHSYNKIVEGHHKKMRENQEDWIGQSNSTRTIIGLTGECNKGGNYKVEVRCHCSNELVMYYNDFLKDKVSCCRKCRPKESYLRSTY